MRLSRREIPSDGRRYGKTKERVDRRGQPGKRVAFARRPNERLEAQRARRRPSFFFFFEIAASIDRRRERETTRNSGGGRESQVAEIAKE